MNYKEDFKQAAESAWSQISITQMTEKELRMFEAGANYELVAQRREYGEIPKMTPKQVFDRLFDGLSPEEHQEKYALIQTLIAGYVLESNHTRLELYKRNTSEVEDFKRRYEEDMRKKVHKARSEAIGVLDAVAAMLKNSTQGTHRMKEFYAYSIINFIKEAKVGLEADFSTDELPF